MTPPQTPLAHFRAELYQTFGLRRDALTDLLDALLTSQRGASLVRLSLAPAFRRGWASVSDALTAGRLDTAAVQRTWAATLPPPAATGRDLWAIDGSTWPRPEAKTSAERTWCRFVTPGQPTSGIVAGWEYQWLVALPEDRGSWVLPLEVRRRGPSAGSPTDLAITQLTAARTAGALADRRPVVLLDSHYDVAALVQAVPEVDLLARLACNRRFYRTPPPDPGKGRPRVHGTVFRLAAATTHGTADLHQEAPDPAYGTVTIDAWHRLHTQAAPTIEVTVLRIQVAHLPRRSTPPAPLWLVWHGEHLPTDLREVWHWYQRRFAIEHAFRFLKQDLGWTTARPRTPKTADRWSQLTACARWELWLARPAVEAMRLPWERTVAPEALSPGRVRRALPALLATVGSPASSPRPRGKSPGRRPGVCPGRAPRYPPQRRAPPPPPATP
jgi:hypothetical protein